MSNNYFDFRTASLPPNVPGAKARAGEVNRVFDAIEAAFDLLPTTPESLELGKTTLGTESGSGNSYVVTMPNTRTSNANGDEVVFRATHTNTGAATLQVDAISAVALRRFNGDPLEANDIVTGRFYAARYDSANTRFVIVWPAQITTVSGGLVYAIPANSVSLAATAEGVATSVLRSDVQLTLSQSIAPTWSAAHTFAASGGPANPSILISSARPGISLNETDAAANNRLWGVEVQSEQLSFFVASDVGSDNRWLAVNRTANTIDSLAFTATAATFSGTLASTGALSGSTVTGGTVTSTGAVSGVTVTGGTVTSTGSLLVDTTVSVRDATNLFSTGTVPAARLPSSFSGLANPTASVGLAAVNGSATTALRSDGAPALSQAIAPTWTELHTFSNATLGALLSSTTPRLDLIETDAAANNTRWGLSVAAEQLQMFVRNDANSSGTNFMAVNRTANTIDSIDFTATAATFSGTLASTGALSGSTLTAGTVTSTGSLLVNTTVSVRDATNLFNTGTVPAARLPGSFNGFANPTASVGLSAVNGSAATAMRSDGAPALSQSIAPTWTATHIFSRVPTVGSLDAAILISSNNPGLTLNDANSATDEKVYDLTIDAGELLLRAANDSGTGHVTVMSVNRTATTIDRVHFPAQAGTANFLVGTLNASAVGPVQMRTTVNNLATFSNTNSANTTVIIHNEGTSGDNAFLGFNTEAGAGTNRGNITYNRGGGVVAYNTTSDRRVKTNIKKSDEARRVIDAVSICAFDYISGGHTDHGFIAQDLHPAVPMAVTAPDEGMWQVDYGKVTPVLWKALQEAFAEIDELKRRLLC